MGRETAEGGFIENECLVGREEDNNAARQNNKRGTFPR
jgi:hypothetical protein